MGKGGREGGDGEGREGEERGGGEKRHALTIAIGHHGFCSVHCPDNSFSIDISAR